MKTPYQTFTCDQLKSFPSPPFIGILKVVLGPISTNPKSFKFSKKERDKIIGTPVVITNIKTVPNAPVLDMWIFTDGQNIFCRGVEVIDVLSKTKPSCFKHKNAKFFLVNEQYTCLDCFKDTPSDPETQFNQTAPWLSDPTITKIRDRINIGKRHGGKNILVSIKEAEFILEAQQSKKDLNRMSTILNNMYLELEQLCMTLRIPLDSSLTEIIKTIKATD